MSRTCLHPIAEAREYPECAGCCEVPDETVWLARRFLAGDRVHAECRPVFLPPITGHVLSHVDHRFDSMRYMRNALRALTNDFPKEAKITWIKMGGRFMFVSPALASELEPDAAVAFDRDLADVIADPVFVTRWGNLYIASLADRYVCWCWNGEQWDDISGGFWTGGREKEWTDCLTRARAAKVSR